MQSDKPQTYNTSLGDPVDQLSVARNQSDLAESISGNTTSSSASVSISSSESHPSSDSICGASTAEGPAAASNGSGSRKRSGDHLDSANDHRQRNHNIPSDRVDAVTQLGGCGAEMLHSSLGRRHAIALVNIDATLWVWWYDRQGPIQSTGIDFIRNLPHLLVLLFAFQRFRLEDWGYDLALDPSIKSRHESDYSVNKTTTEKGKEALSRIAATPVDFAINSELRIRYKVPMQAPLYAPFCLKGRSTVGFGVTNASNEANTPDEPTPFVAKLYWPHRDRLKEEETIERARGVAKDLPDHLPFVERVGY
ncbi:hypothetical protein RSOL_102550, partial [Rhizoctonia solani AG-3 Rhs1AP]